MIQPSLNSLNIILSGTKKASESELCWREFLVATSYFTDYCSKFITEEEIADITKSLFNWTHRKDLMKYKVRDTSNIQGPMIEGAINLGDIFLVDLGINYKPECSYAHPALILEEIDNMFAVIPTSTNLQKIKDAFDPNTNPSGKWYYKKVDKSNGFADECVLMLNNLKVISKGRLIQYKSHLNEDINKPDSIFVNLKTTIFEHFLPKQYILNLKLIQENNRLRVCDIKIFF